MEIPIKMDDLEVPLFLETPFLWPTKKGSIISFLGGESSIFNLRFSHVGCAVPCAF